MHCASCASIIERTVKKIDGVSDISVNSGTENAKILFNGSQINSEDFNKKLEPLGYSLIEDVTHASHGMTAKDMGMSEDEHAEHLGLNQSKKDKLLEIKDMKIKIMSAIPIAIFSFFVMAWEISKI